MIEVILYCVNFASYKENNLKTSARVVVIGGGVVGCSVLYHLAKNGWTDVILLERQELTSGSSWHAAGGLFTTTRPNSVAELHNYTFQIYKDLERESDQACGFHHTGGLNICRTEEEISSNQAMQSACRRLGIDSHFISKEEAKERAPVLDTSFFINALWEENGGHVDPASATQAFAIAARKLGASIYRQTPVISTRQLSDSSWEVKTHNGKIKTEFLVNAAGLWGREVGKMAGIELPLLPVEHHYLVTENMPNIEELEFELPQINDNETGSYARQEGMGMLLGAYESKCVHWAKKGTPKDFGHELLPNDISRMEWNFERSVELMPSLGMAGIKKIINGPMIFSPDLGPLLGPHPLLENYFCANGVMNGFNQGAGIGRVISEWLIQGEPEFDIFNWDVARFGDWASLSYTEKATKYFYENRSEKTYPYQEFDVGRPINKPTIYDELNNAGAVFGSSFGLEHPNWFTNCKPKKDSLTFKQPNWWNIVAEEGAHIRNAVGLMEFSAMAKFTVSGPNAETWLNTIMANSMPKLGKIKLSPMFSENGKLIGDFSITHLSENNFLLLGSDYMQLGFLRHFKNYLPREGVELKNVSSELSGLHICGPNAQKLISNLTDRDMTTEKFNFMSADKISIGDNLDVTTCRISFTGECGYELYTNRADQLDLFKCLINEGKKLDIGLVGTRSLMQTRLEKSFMAWGRELSPDYSPIECEQLKHIDLNKTYFVGKSAVENNKLAREKYATFTVEAKENAIWGDEAIFLNDKPIGYVTSGGWGPFVNQHIALGYIKPETFDEKNEFFIEILGKLMPAKLSNKPLYDPLGLKMRL